MEHTEQARVKAFRALKPPCVDLSQVVLRHKSKKANTKDIINSLENLHETVKTVSGALDSKLAEYVFFPLSHIFRDSKDLPIRAVEVALQCLQILISQGWRDRLQYELSKQLLILLCFLAGGSAADTKVKDVNEELSATAFDCLSSLFQASNGACLGAKSVDAKDIPILGHTVTVMIDGVTDGPSVGVRLSALYALDSLVNDITDKEALKGVFPGIVSSLTKVLSFKTGSKRSYKALTTGLGVLTAVICKVINDGEDGDSSSVQQGPVMAVNSNEGEKTSWATATSAQIRMALANIMPLRYHERPEVQEALMQLCTSIIQKCRTSLSQSVPMLTETLVVLCSHSMDAAAVFNLGRIFATDSSLLDMVKGSLHDWIVALPRVMQSNDDTKKERSIEQISTAFRILESHTMDLDVLNDSMAVNLRASVSAAIQASPTAHPISESSLEVSQLIRSASITSKSPVIFPPVLFSESSNRATRFGLQRLASQLQETPMSTQLRQDMIRTLRTTSGEEQLAGLWLSLQLLSHASAESAIIDQYLHLPPGQGSRDLLLDDVYSFSLDVVSRSTFEDEGRWELQALSLEAIALQARSYRQDFRPELVDALYPILERLGSNNAALQQHAITCLNTVSTACDYPSSASLIIDNADYLVNAVALKLNTFDISPQAPQVLVMMVRLCGSTLIPYLDDLVESIFSILACYHGYPKLVESLFSVLNAIVEEAAKSFTRAIKPSTDTTTRPKVYKPCTIADLALILRSNLERGKDPLLPPPSPPTSPTRPLSQKDFPPLEVPEDAEPPADPPAATPSKTDTLLTSIITQTPSHLSTPSPPLRTHILNLLTSALPLLSTNTDRFLPLAAQLFPLITARLHDHSPPTALAATNALATLCHCAGDFLSSRIETEWTTLLTLYARLEADAASEPRRGPKQTLRNGMIRLLLAAVTDVGVSPGMEDGVFEALGGVAAEREDVRAALEGLNADALWLVEEKARRRKGGERGGMVAPVGEGMEGWGLGI